jgi:hypothetical protein
VLNDLPGGATAPTAVNTPAGGFTVTAQSKAGVTYTITRSATGTTSRTCTPVNKGGCNSGGSW